MAKKEKPVNNNDLSGEFDGLEVLSSDGLGETSDKVIFHQAFVPSVGTNFQSAAEENSFKAVIRRF